MKWALVGKPDLGQYLKDARAIHTHLKKKRQTVLVDSVLASALKVPGVPLKKLDADVFVALGGDGTMLLTFMYTDRPVLAINAGGIGFLSEIEPKYAFTALDRILAGDYTIDERPKLSCTVGSKRVEDAANEITVQTARIAKLIKFRIEIDGEVIDTMRGDGVIVATATGSTGYSLSVGGPILHPGVEAAVISPIAPFRLGARPLVVPASSTIRVTLLERRSRLEKPAKVVLDGQRAYEIPSNTVTTIRASNTRARFIRFNSGFFDRVRTKLTR